MPASTPLQSLGSSPTAEVHSVATTNHPIGGRVIIVDRHALVAQSLAMVLAAASVTTFVATDPSLDVVLRHVRAFDPDLVLVDANTDEATELVRALSRQGTKVVVVTDGSDRIRVASCLEVGAAGAVSTLDAVDRLLSTIRETVAGRRAIPTSTERDLLGELQTHRRERAVRQSRFHTLSAREAEVLEELMAGKSAADIAGESFVSIATIRSQIKAILRKLEVNSQLAAVAMAYQAGWSRHSLRATPAPGRPREMSIPRR